MSSVSQFPPSYLIEYEQDVNERRNEEARNTEIEDQAVPLALPAPSDANAEASSALQAGQDDSVVRFDHLGPLVVNTDGTLSRIHNWDALSEGERQTTLRVLVKRNKSRMEAIKAQEGEPRQGEAPAS